MVRGSVSWRIKLRSLANCFAQLKFGNALFLEKCKTIRQELQNNVPKTRQNNSPTYRVLRMKTRISSHLFMMLIGILIGNTVMPALCQQVGQKMFVGPTSQKEFETLTLEKKMAALNIKLDYLIQKSLPSMYYIDNDGVVQRQRLVPMDHGTVGPARGGSAGSAGTFKVDQ